MRRTAPAANVVAVSPTTWPELARAVIDVLAARGPLRRSALVRALAAHPSFRDVDADEAFETLLDHDALPLVTELLDERWCDLDSLLSGRVVTHRLDSREVEHGVLAAYPDLAPLIVLLDACPTPDGSSDLLYPDLDAGLVADLGLPADAVPTEGVWPLPPGFVAGHGLRPGDLVTLRVGDAGLIVETAARPDAEPWPAEAVAIMADLLERHPEGVETEQAAWALCVALPAAFAEPGPPFADLLAQTGAVAHGEHVLPSGTDVARWQDERRVDAIAATHHLGDDSALAVAALAARYQSLLGVLEGRGARDLLDDAEVLAPLAATLADASAAEALLAETLGTEDGLAPAALGVLVDDLADRVHPDTAPAVHAALGWLRARALDRLGDDGAAAAELAAAYEHDPSWPPVLEDLAHDASDRGDLDRALELAERAGLPADDPLMSLLRHLRGLSVRDLGRNQQCWCGSGRKYKVCHLGREELPLAERGIWLYQKAGMYLDRGPHRRLVLDLATERSQFMPGGLWQAITDPVVSDVALAEGGVFAEFLRRRGDRLPDDERSLAEQWLLAERTVWEVEAVQYARGLLLRDVRTGDRVQVRERSASRMLRVGELFCGRVLPAGDTWQLFGGLEPVALHERDDLIALLDGEPDPLDLVAALSRRFAPPRLQNTEGEDLLLGETTLRVPDVAAGIAALDAAFERAADGPAADGLITWHQLIDTPTGRTLRAALTLDADVIRLEANSAARLDRVLARLGELIPDLVVLSDRRTPVADVVPSSAAAAPSDEIDPDTLAQVLGEVVARHEVAWLDEAVPALNGFTPRAAAADPTRRGDLVRLLDSFPQEEAPGRMSPHRLRAALGLG